MRATPSLPPPPYGRWQASQYVVYVDLFFFFLFLFLSCNTPTHLFCLSPDAFILRYERTDKWKKETARYFSWNGKSSQFATSMCDTINKTPPKIIIIFFFGGGSSAPNQFWDLLSIPSRVTFIPSSTLTIEYCSVTLIWFSLSSVEEMTCSPVFRVHRSRQ